MKQYPVVFSAPDLRKAQIACQGLEDRWPGCGAEIHSNQNSSYSEVFITKPEKIPHGKKYAEAWVYGYVWAKDHK